MKKLEIKKETITEDKISALVNFLDTWVIPEWWSESRLAIFYWQIKYHGMKLDKAEEWLEKDRQKKREAYKWRIINEIKQWNEDMRNENWWWYNPYKYEIVNVKNWEWWRTMQIWFRDIDIDWKTKRKHSVLIEEVYNPDFFNEMLEKYAPKETLQPNWF